jgi:D-threo-aldose 1-dehydrogenase
MPELPATGALERRRLGAAGPEVTALTFGSAPLATIFWENDESTAVATAAAARDAGIRLFDTAPFYGLGEAEQRLGVALAGSDPSEVLIATKVGRTIVGSGADRDVVFDFSADAVHRQLEASFDRLGRERADVVHVHDPEDHLTEALDECLPALAALRDEGIVGAISVGTNVCATVLTFLREADPDVVMLAGRLTLLDRSALDEVVPECARRGVPLLAAGVFNSGILADPRPGRWYDYAPADDATLQRVREMAGICADAGVALRTAALAFPLSFAPVASVVVGMASPAEVRDNVAALDTALPAGLWDALDI